MFDDLEDSLSDRFICYDAGYDGIAWFRPFGSIKINIWKIKVLF